MTVSRKLPECWGHRGASVAFPENTLASFQAAIQDGAEGLESDVHVSKDDVVIMFHDPTLDRTTDGKGAIKDQNWYGPDGIEHRRTTKEPKQSIPTFAETVALLMQAENQHVKFNVDVKVNNDPEHLFKLIHAIISAQPNWQTTLAPRLLIGLWHPKFIAPCKEILPFCRRAYIGLSIQIAREFFWNHCEAFSVLFHTLSTPEGQKFLNDCHREGKQVCVWTVNDRNWMLECVQWGVDAILTDVTKTWLDLRTALNADYDGQMAKLDVSFKWRDARFWAPLRLARLVLTKAHLEKIGGPFDIATTRQKEKQYFRTLRSFLQFEGGFWVTYGLFMLRIFKP